jgi:hypothetical protein
MLTTQLFKVQCKNLNYGKRFPAVIQHYTITRINQYQSFDHISMAWYDFNWKYTVFNLNCSISDRRSRLKTTLNSCKKKFNWKEMSKLLSWTLK